MRCRRANNRLVTEMHTVKNANREKDRTWHIRQLRDRSENLH
jgi:hypothetical protein